MRIFILEDSKERIQTFKKFFFNADLVIMENAKEAIEFLSKDLEFDVIYLDHDLGVQAFVDSQNDNTGYQVAKFLANKTTQAKIIIHSLNPIGVMNMQKILPESHRIPFFNLFNGV
jgi:CheY-like chemotaxis protein